MASRRFARQQALQLLYQLDLRPPKGSDRSFGVEAAMSLFWQGQAREMAANPADVSPEELEEELLEMGDEEQVEAKPKLVDGAADPVDIAFAQLLVRGVHDNLDAIDDLITAASHNWKVGRMSYVDRNILRLAVYELRDLEDIPSNVSINEGIELGKKFGTTDSGSFINGILDRVARKLKRIE